MITLNTSNKKGIVNLCHPILLYCHNPSPTQNEVGVTTYLSGTHHHHHNTPHKLYLGRRMRGKRRRQAQLLGPVKEEGSYWEEPYSQTDFME